MKHLTLTLFLSLLLLAPSAFSQDDDWYRPGGFDAIGRSYKTFSVSDTKKVHFSRGNLQYNAAQNKWRFALRQYNYACGDNNNISETYDGWIDLFGWGTSGWNSATAYQPWTTSITEAEYCPGGNDASNLTDEYVNADWGVYNKISNGGNKAGQWRILTKEEWGYLIDRSGKYGLATIGDIYKGLVLLPDDWTLPTGLSFTSGYGNGGYTANTYTMAQWQTMEAAGAVFLPAAGYRHISDLNDVSTHGLYWSSTHFSVSGAWDAYFHDSYVGINYEGRTYGCSVRLVADENPNVSKAFDLEGASYKTFSVADGRTVHFSKGNLRYNAATNTWAFASKQYLCIGEANSNISESYNGWIDLFGWGTSGWNSGATAFQPWSTSETESDYYPGGSATNSLTGDYANADWGVYNKIINGGNKAGKWRTLTHDEWEYLIGNNTQRSGKHGLATIGGTYKGLVILPDDWTSPNGVSFTAGYGSGFTTNTYTTAQWQKMEDAGALFLPAAGYRHSTNVENIGSSGYYLSSSYNNESYTWCMSFYGDNVDMYNSSRYDGQSVRLVKD
ncbi:MAG: hypothetical protein II975_00090 [Bacteroidales bacterium]|nr:hypothetical protein [Bacteroidales bacterium]